VSSEPFDIMTDTIKLYHVLGKPLVWDANDWYKLRSEHKIMGSLIGVPAHFPRQVSYFGVPFCLFPYEVTYLIENKICSLLKLKSPHACPSETVKKEFEKSTLEVNKEIEESIEKERKQQVEIMIDRIIEGKKRKKMGLTGRKSLPQVEKEDENGSDREAMLKEEFKKIEETPRTANIVQIPSVDPWFEDEDFEEAEWTYPSTPLERLKYDVYKDMLGKGYYVTHGVKFGGDFLVYLGEPCRFHAHMVVLCVEQNSPISLIDLIHHARLATVTKKTFVIASTDENGKLVYQSVQWPGSY